MVMHAFTPGGPGQEILLREVSGGQSGPFTYTYTTGGTENPFGNVDFGDPFDIFEAFFGGGNPFGRAKRRQQIPRYSITIDFMEAVKGVCKGSWYWWKKKKNQNSGRNL